jgi:hypothetical protein
MNIFKLLNLYRRKADQSLLKMLSVYIHLMDKMKLLREENKSEVNFLI